jgi:hypothetical protein
MLVGCFSPLVKCFLPQYEVLEEGKEPRIVYQKDLKENPELVRKVERFRFAVPRPVGAQIFVYGEPREISDKNLIQWLVGGENNAEQETQWTGLVGVQMSAELQGAMMAVVAAGGNPGDIKASMNEAIEKARVISERRVMSQIKFIYQNYQDQLQLNKELKQGDFQFSTTEFLCHYVLDDEIKKRDKANEKANALMSQFGDNVRKATATL